MANTVEEQATTDVVENTDSASGETKDTVNQTATETFTRKQLDEQAKLTRTATERDTKKKLLAQFGLKDGEEDKLAEIKEIYKKSLSNEQKINIELEQSRETIASLSSELEEKNYIISALIATTGSELSTVTNIVKMARGFKSEDVTIEDAIKTVMTMIQPKGTQKVPVGSQLDQPHNPTIPPLNPFKDGSINYTLQAKMYRETPELARKMAKEAGVALDY